jgi:hypothetical protein
MTGNEQQAFQFISHCIYCETAGLTWDKVIVSKECISRFGAFLYSRWVHHEIHWNNLSAPHAEIVWHNRMSQHDKIHQSLMKWVCTIALQSMISKIPYLYRISKHVQRTYVCTYKGLNSSSTIKILVGNLYELGFNLSKEYGLVSLPRVFKYTLLTIVLAKSKLAIPSLHQNNCLPLF